MTTTTTNYDDYYYYYYYCSYYWAKVLKGGLCRSLGYRVDLVLLVAIALRTRTMITITIIPRKSRSNNVQEPLDRCRFSSAQMFVSVVGHCCT